MGEPAMRMRCVLQACCSVDEPAAHASDQSPACIPLILFVVPRLPQFLCPGVLPCPSCIQNTTLQFIPPGKYHYFQRKNFLTVKKQKKKTNKQTKNPTERKHSHLYKRGLLNVKYNRVPSMSAL